MKKLMFLAAFLGLGYFGLANASAIKVWTTETFRATDLNTTLAHVHDNMVGGHGARLVNADVATTAAIAHSKLATPAIVPKAWAYVGSATCAASPCTVAVGSGISGITRTSAGLYVATFTTTRSDTNYGVGVTPATADINCRWAATSTSTTTITCKSNGTEAVAPAATDTAFFMFLMDDT